MDKYVGQNNPNIISTNIIMFQKEKQNHNNNNEKINKYSGPYLNHFIERNIIGSLKIIIINA